MFAANRVVEWRRRIEIRIAAVCSVVMVCVLLAAAPQAVMAQQPSGGEQAKSAATAAPASSPEQNAADLAPPEGRYRIGPDDVLDIRVFNRPQYSRDGVRVDTLGFIRMPLIAGDIRAACRTEIELAAVVAEAYRKYLKKPHVEVFVREYNAHPVAVLGAVNLGGRFQLRREMRLVNLLTYAGGPTPNAGRSVQLVRGADTVGCQADDPSVAVEMPADASAKDGAAITSYDLEAVMKGDDAANPYVRPGDIITVLKADEAYLIGNVMRPLTIALNEPVPLSRAIAMAGGLAPDSKSKKVSIVRTKPGSNERTILIADLAAINKLQAEDILLQPNDIIDVPTNNVKRTLRGVVTGLIPNIATLPLRVIP